VGDTILRPLTDTREDASRGREIAFDRERGNCPICHVLPALDAALHGDMGPSLRGLADRLSEGQIRLRLVDGSRLNPSTVMPAYYRVSGLKRVAAVYASKPVLAAQEIEDLVALPDDAARRGEVTC
jgi:sulfur-oxidizing protein SoxX